MADEDWKDRIEEFDKRPVRTTAKGMTKAWFLGIVAIVLCGFTAVGLWVFGVFTSDVKGQGDAEKYKNSAENRIESQELFEDYFADIQATDDNITITAEALAQDPNNQKLITEYNGQRMYCNQIVGEYNAAARKFTREQFRAVDLPEKIDKTDPETDCEKDAP